MHTDPMFLGHHWLLSPCPQRWQFYVARNGYELHDINRESGAGALQAVPVLLARGATVRKVESVLGWVLDARFGIGNIAHAYD